MAAVSARVDGAVVRTRAAAGAWARSWPGSRLGERLPGLFMDRGRTGRRLSRRPASPSLTIGAFLCALLLLAGLAAPVVSPYAADQVMAGPRLSAPSALHPFGTDALGRDMLSRVLNGAGLAIQLVVVGLATAGGLGTTTGLIAGYAGGRADQLLSRVVDVALAFPGLLLALVVVARLGPSLQNAALALGIVGLPAFFRLARTLTMSARQAPYVEAARAMGVSPIRLICGHVLPNIGGPLVAMSALRAGTLILAGGSLGFVGLGAQPPQPEWGVLLASGWTYLDGAPWLAVFPGLFVVLSVIGLNLLGDGLRDLMDPRLGQARRLG